MNLSKLKNYLISTGFFDDNTFLDQYLQLIDNYDTTHNYTECHHVIPVSFYRHYDNNNKKYSRYQLEKLAEQDPNNAIICLSYKDHCIAHYLLYKCALKSFKYAMKTSYALLHKQYNKDLTEQDIIELETYYDNICTKVDVIELQNIYKNSNYSVTAVAKHFKISRKLARSKLIACGIYQSRTKPAKITKALIQQLQTNTEFIEYAKSHSQSETANNFGYSRYEIQRIMVKLQITNYDQTKKNDIHSAWNKGLTKEDTNFYSAELLAKLAANKGKKLTTAQKLKLSNAATNKRKVICIETGIVFESVTAAAKYCNLHTSNIVICCKNSSKTARGYHWSYFE